MTVAAYRREAKSTADDVRIRCLSVVVPAYNEEERIGGTIEAIVDCAERILHDYEIIVVDDGSSDRTPQIIAAYVSDKIRVITHKANKGVGAAFFDALEIARFPYISLFPGDNAYSKEAIENVFGAVGKASMVVSYRDNMDVRTILRRSLSVLCTVSMCLLTGRIIRDAHSVFVYPVDLARLISAPPNYSYHILTIGPLLARVETIVQVPAPLNDRPDASSGVMRFSVLWSLITALLRLAAWRIGLSPGLTKPGFFMNRPTRSDPAVALGQRPAP